MPRAILFDLDGTLVDTRTASWELFAETNAKFNLGIETREAFFAIFEHNFFHSISMLPVEPERMRAAKAHFMHALHTRYCPPFIPGMVDVVRALAADSTLAVVSANTMGAIRRILRNEQVATCFAHVFSGDLEAHKSRSIQRFIGARGYAAKRLCSPDYHTTDADVPTLDAEDLVLVTDTVGDITEATQAGICAIGVNWGMHSEQQLLQAGAQQVALWPQELLVWLRPGADVQPILSTTDDSAAAPCPCQPPSAPIEMAAGDGKTHNSGLLRRHLQMQRRQQARAALTAKTGQGQVQLHQALAQIMDGEFATRPAPMALTH